MAGGRIVRVALVLFAQTAMGDEIETVSTGLFGDGAPKESLVMPLRAIQIRAMVLTILASTIHIWSVNCRWRVLIRNGSKCGPDLIWLDVLHLVMTHKLFNYGAIEMS